MSLAVLPLHYFLKVIVVPCLEKLSISQCFRHCENSTKNSRSEQHISSIWGHQPGLPFATCAVSLCSPLPSTGVQLQASCAFISDDCILLFVRTRLFFHVTTVVVKLRKLTVNLSSFTTCMPAFPTVPVLFLEQFFLRSSTMRLVMFLLQLEAASQPFLNLS